VELWERKKAAEADMIQVQARVMIQSTGDASAGKKVLVKVTAMMIMFRIASSKFIRSIKIFFI
jgi:hypothetical protein